jgi:putative membrane protein
MNFLTRLLISAAAVLLSSYLIDGVVINGFVSALIVALFLGLLNVLFKPILLILTIPLTILTFGLFLFVINAIIVLMVDGVVAGFSVSSVWTAILFSLILSIITSVLEAIFDVKKPNE